MITAKIIADSISDSQIRIVTMELNYPRFIHSEFMTHRMFSRNASSSRAIPIEKMIKQVQENPAMPIHWGKNQPGMQAREELHETAVVKQMWNFAGQDARCWADQLNRQGCHKQIANRLLEPYQYIKVIVTATEWDNFFKLRLHPDAQPEIQELAKQMKKAMDESTPKLLRYGEWHLPYVPTDIQENGLWDYIDTDCPVFDYEKAIKCSVARCARVSYLNHDNSSPDVEKDIALYNKLLEAWHMSPFEHQATPMDFAKDTYELNWEEGVTHKDRKDNFWSGNFRGWIQYRQLL